jgi:hypothetical protein
LFSPTYELIILPTCCVRSSLPMPSLSIPALLLANGQVLHPAGLDRVEQPLGNAAQAEPAAAISMPSWSSPSSAAAASG